MKKEKVDDSICYQDIYTDGDDVTWNLLVRSDASVSVYGTKKGDAAHYVIHDTLDGKPPTDDAKAVLYMFEMLGDFSGLEKAAIQMILKTKWTT